MLEALYVTNDRRAVFKTVICLTQEESDNCVSSEKDSATINGTLPIDSLKDIVNVLFCSVFQAYASGLEGHHPH